LEETFWTYTKIDPSSREGSALLGQNFITSHA
jgi:hypothetical protein